MKGSYVVGTFLLLGVTSLSAEEARDAARTVVGKYAPAVITVQLTLQSHMVFQGREGQSRQMTMEIAGTLVKPSGLTVVSNFSSNPSDLAPSREEGPKLEAEITDAKLILHDGRELAAKVVLRDQDLDLAFLMPDEKGLALPYVPLEKAKVPETLDDLIFLYPLGKSLNREVAVAFGKVRAVTRKPRVFIVSDLLNGIQSLGCPVFGADGQPVGLVVLRRPAVTPNSGSVRDFLDIMNPVVLTAEDVQQVAAQASMSKP